MQLNIKRPNDAWIIHREDISTVQEGACNAYALLDAFSGFCFGIEVIADQPSDVQISTLLNKAFQEAGCWPSKILLLKSEPHIEAIENVCLHFHIVVNVLPAKDIRPYIIDFSSSFRQILRGKLSHEGIDCSEEEQKEIDDFIPDTYGPCPCASGDIFKKCCQKIFTDITFAMCAAEEGDIYKALQHMGDAESKVGRTAEVICRYAICWSFFDKQKFSKYLNEALGINPNHPRLNYILGIGAVEAGKYNLAVEYYTKAIENYSKEDKYHLNETYNNLGTAHCKLGDYSGAKEAWEKALVLIPYDKMVKRNLFEHIYNNLSLPEELREMSPFIEKYLNKYL
jgi:hypothetical protein